MLLSFLGRPAPFAASYMVDREDKRTKNRTMLPTLKNNAAAGYQGPLKIELLKGAGLLSFFMVLCSPSEKTAFFHSVSE